MLETAKEMKTCNSTSLRWHYPVQVLGVPCRSTISACVLPQEYASLNFPFDHNTVAKKEQAKDGRAQLPPGGKTKRRGAPLASHVQKWHINWAATPAVARGTGLNKGARKGVITKLLRRSQLTKIAVLLLVSLTALAGCDLAEFGLGFQPPLPGPGELVVSYLDVDQGDASLLQTEGCTVLIDAGRHDRDDVPPYLQAAQVEEIDLLVLTHPHADHIGQAAAVLYNWPVAEVWMSGWEHNTRTFERTLDAITETGSGYYEPRAGEIRRCGPLTIEVLNPKDPLTDIHDDIALRITFGEVAFIWTGDAEAKHEENMLNYGHPLQAEVLQLGHHGSSTSTSRAFVEAVDPLLAIYSAGVDNTYGHPHREVVQLLDEMEIEMLGTDWAGTIWLTTDGEVIDVLLESEIH